MSESPELIPDRRAKFAMDLVMRMSVAKVYRMDENEIKSNGDSQKTVSACEHQMGEEMIVNRAFELADRTWKAIEEHGWMYDATAIRYD